MPAKLQPQRYGSNTLRMALPREGVYTFEVQAEATSDWGSPTQLGATLIVERFDGPVEYRPLQVEGTAATLVADDLDGAKAAYVLVGTWTDAYVTPTSDEVFPYRYRVLYEAPAGSGPSGGDPLVPVDETPRAACGCASGSTTTPWWGLALAGLFVLRRRQHG